MLAEVSFVLSQFTRLTDRWTVRQAAFSWLYHALHYMQSHSKKENYKFLFVCTALLSKYFYQMHIW